MSIFKRNHGLRALISLIAVVSVFMTGSLNGYAGGFTHRHTDSCYRTVTKTCSNHRIWVEHNTNTYHCTTCLVQTTFNQDVYWDICNNGLTGNRDAGYVQRCSVCGTLRRNDTNVKPVSHNYNVRECVCGFEDGASEADVNLTADSTAWTKDGVNLNASSDELERVFERCFSLQTLIVRSSFFGFLPTTIPPYTSTFAPINKSPLSCAL